ELMLRLPDVERCALSRAAPVPLDSACHVAVKMKRDRRVEGNLRRVFRMRVERFEQLHASLDLASADQQLPEGSLHRLGKDRVARGDRTLDRLFGLGNTFIREAGIEKTLA